MRAVQSSPESLADHPGDRHVGFVRPDETHRLARNRHPHLDLGANRDELDERAERIHQERVSLVLAVEADLASDEAGGDADANAVGHGRIEA